VTVLLSVLGPVELTVAGRPVDLGPARQRAVLAALAVDAGQPVSVDALIDRVWGGAAQPGARSGLYSYLTRLRRVFTQAGVAESVLRVVSRPGGYVLEIDPELVDCCRFRRLVRSDSTVDDEARADRLDAAIGLWRGPALADLTGEWVERTRQLFGQERLDAHVLWAGAQLRLGRVGQVLGPLRALLDEYPLVEPLAARLIEALARDGRAAEGLRWYAATRRRLIDELGTEPGPELRRLHQALLAGELEPAPMPALWATLGIPMPQRRWQPPTHPLPDVPSLAALDAAWAPVPAAVPVGGPAEADRAIRPAASWAGAQRPAGPAGAAGTGGSAAGTGGARPVKHAPTALPAA